MTVLISDISHADSTAELDALVELAAKEHGVQLHTDESFAESAGRTCGEDKELAELLLAAERRWFELEE